MITDGGDDYEDMSEESFSKLKQFMHNQQVNILVVGYTYSIKKVTFLQKLAGVTVQSQYIDIDHAEDLDPFLKSIVEQSQGIVICFKKF